MRKWAGASAAFLAASLTCYSSAASSSIGPINSKLSSCYQAAQDVVYQLQAAHNPLNPSARIAIIIDDLGYNRRLGQMAVALPGAVTLAILPRSPHAHRLAAEAAEAGKEVIVHLPMSTIAGSTLDEGGLTETMGRDDFLEVLRRNLQAVAQAKGANNHMGSLLTQQHEPMQWLMDELSAQGLYFIDSRTSPQSIASQVARENGLPVLEREIFLDNKKDCDAIAEQFLHLARVAQRHDQSLAIGHPYPETLTFLAALLPHLNVTGLVLLTGSQLLGDNEKQSAIELKESDDAVNSDMLNNPDMK